LIISIVYVLCLISHQFVQQFFILRRCIIFLLNLSYKIIAQILLQILSQILSQINFESMKLYVSISLFFVVFSVFAQKPITTIPFELHGDHIIIKMSVDGSAPLDFIFDTGDGLTVLDLEKAKELNLPLNHKKLTTSIQGTITGADVKHNTLSINDLLMEKNVNIYATSINHLEMSIGRKLDGIIGYDLLRHHSIRINYDDMLFEIYKSGEGPKIGDAVNIKMVNAMPVLETSAVLNNDEIISGDFYIYTGAGTTLDFNTPIAKEKNIIDKTGQHYSYLIKGLGDIESLHYEGRVKSFTVGSSQFTDLPIGISQSLGGVQGDKKTAGIIGNRLLKQYNMTIDISTSKIYLEKNKKFEDTFAVNCSGLDLQLTNKLDQILIHKVIENSPAEKMGLKVDDILVSVNGKDAIKMGIASIEELLKKEGETVSLIIKSGIEEREVMLTLKSLI